jgi:hypothetical protein
VVAALAATHGVAAPRAAATSGTNARVNTASGAVNITVPIDLHGPRRLTDSHGRPTTLEALAKLWKTTAERRWNAAFKRLTYRAPCLADGRSDPALRFHLKVNIDLFPLNGGGHAGHHQIKMFNRPGEGHVYRPSGSPQKPSDFGTVYSKPAKGDWGRLDGDVATHEISHLMGLSDDYVKRNGRPVPITRDGVNRKGTLLADPKGRIDQQLIDRLGKMILRATGAKLACLIDYGITVDGAMAIAYGDDRVQKDAHVEWSGVWKKVTFRVFDTRGALVVGPAQEGLVPGTITATYAFKVVNTQEGSCTGSLVGRSYDASLTASAVAAPGTSQGNFHLITQIAGLGEPWTADRHGAYDGGCGSGTVLGTEAHLIDNGYEFHHWETQDSHGIAIDFGLGLLTAEAKLENQAGRPFPINAFGSGKRFEIRTSTQTTDADGTRATSSLRVLFIRV